MVGIERGKLRLFRLAVCESIEISHVIFFIEQRLIGVLSVDADEPFRKLPHDRQRHRASVDSGGGYAFIGDVPLEKQRSVLRLDAELRRKAGSLGPDRFKQCRNRRFFLSGAQKLAGRSFAHDESHGIDDDGFAGPGFARQDRQSRSGTHALTPYDRDIADVQLL